MSSIETIVADKLQTLEHEGRLRTLSTSSAPLIDFCSNDYMGLAAKYAQLAATFREQVWRHPTSSSASRLLAQPFDAFRSLENKLEQLYAAPALIFNSGYHCNVGAISALASLPGTLVIADKLAHASMIDGMILSRSPFERFPHNDITRLRRILERKASSFEAIIIVAEAIYSMDGDIAPLHDLVALKKDFPNVAIYLDEAHSFGVRGKRGLGLAEEFGFIADIDFIVGTLGKAAASQGAFIICSETLRSFFINTARPLIFSTALPPQSAAWSEAMISMLIGMEEERTHLSIISDTFRKGLESITGTPSVSSSQIIPWITGSAVAAVEKATQLRQRGFGCLPVRRPTVAAGTERIRFSLNAGLTPADINNLLNAIADIA